jgi:hypothetical protein
VAAAATMLLLLLLPADICLISRSSFVCFLNATTKKRKYLTASALPPVECTATGGTA